MPLGQYVVSVGKPQYLCKVRNCSNCTAAAAKCVVLLEFVRYHQRAKTRYESAFQPICDRDALGWDFRTITRTSTHSKHMHRL